MGEWVVPNAYFFLHSGWLGHGKCLRKQNLGQCGSSWPPKAAKNQYIMGRLKVQAFQEHLSGAAQGF